MTRLKGSITPYQRPLEAQDARRAWHERRGLILTLSDAEGRQGRGEAAPLPGYSRETLAEVEAALAELALEADPARSLPEILALAPATLPASARFAVESALLEWWGACRGLSLESALGARPGPFPMAHLLSSLDLELLPQVLPGAAALKVKIGRPGRLAEELDFLAEVKRRTPLPIRVDANQAFYEETPAVLAALAELGVELVEEPSLDTLALLDSPVPLALDETLLDHLPTAAMLKERPFIQALVLKPSCLGLAQTLGLAWLGPAPIISHTYEGPIGQRVLHALARALPSRFAHGVGPYRPAEPS